MKVNRRAVSFSTFLIRRVEATSPDLLRPGKADNPCIIPTRTMSTVPICCKDLNPLRLLENFKKRPVKIKSNPIKQVRKRPLNPKIRNLVNKYSGNPIAALRTIVTNRLLNKTEPSLWEEYSRLMIYWITFKKSYLNKIRAVVAVEK